MAGIEKICEYSGDYTGGDMYEYKCDHIQILPKYRKLFKNKECILFIFEPELVRICPSDYIYLRLPFMKQALSIPKFYKRCFLDKFYKINKYDLEYNYCLFVPEIKGNVSGFYYNYSYNIMKVIRNMKKMIGDFKPDDIIIVPFTIEKWHDMHKLNSGTKLLTSFLSDEYIEYLENDIDYKIRK